METGTALEGFPCWTGESEDAGPFVAVNRRRSGTRGLNLLSRGLGSLGCVLAPCMHWCVFACVSDPMGVGVSLFAELVLSKCLLQARSWVFGESTW